MGLTLPHNNNLKIFVDVSNHFNLVCKGKNIIIRFQTLVPVRLKYIIPHKGRKSMTLCKHIVTLLKTELMNLSSTFMLKCYVISVN